ncbi:MAG: heparinase, partial [Erythrobacter sp.]
MATLFDDERAASTNKAGNTKQERSALPLSGRAEPLVDDAPARRAPPPAHSEREQPRALALTDVIAPRTGAGETLIRMAYRIG